MTQSPTPTSTPDPSTPRLRTNLPPLPLIPRTEIGVHIDAATSRANVFDLLHDPDSPDISVGWLVRGRTPNTWTPVLPSGEFLALVEVSSDRASRALVHQHRGFRSRPHLDMRQATIVAGTTVLKTWRSVDVVDVWDPPLSAVVPIGTLTRDHDSGRWVGVLVATGDEVCSRKTSNIAARDVYVAHCRHLGLVVPPIFGQDPDRAPEAPAEVVRYPSSHSGWPRDTSAIGGVLRRQVDASTYELGVRQPDQTVSVVGRASRDENTGRWVAVEIATGRTTVPSRLVRKTVAAFADLIGTAELVPQD